MKYGEKGIQRWIWAVVLFIAIGLMLSGEDTGSIWGKICDPEGAPLPGVEVTAVHQLLNISYSGFSNDSGIYRLLSLPKGDYEIWIKLEGFQTIVRRTSVQTGQQKRIDFSLSLGALNETIVIDDTSGNFRTRTNQSFPGRRDRDFNTEEYSNIVENRWHKVRTTPLSTFSIDVDTASYANVRRYITNGALPPADAVRIEEMINYFDYEYPLPAEKEPFSISAGVAPCPWEEKHLLLHIGLQGRKMDTDKIPPANLVFLIDVSGSMNDRNKLPLLKSSFRLLVEQLRGIDRVAVVIYAGAAGLVLPATSGKNQEKILGILDNMEAGGSTAGGEGIQLAYRIAEENFIARGNNRVILATDGDFNVGISDTGSLVRFIEEKKKQGISLSVLGFGMGNYKDSRLEQLADKGDGNYHYIDNILEGKKVLVDELYGTLFTIAKDVKIQVEFNPARIKSYRLIGYENRLLADEDFKDDRKDAGEIGSGHRVTALYEMIPGDGSKGEPETDELRYQDRVMKKGTTASKEWLMVNIRYKEPDEGKSKLLTKPVLSLMDGLDENMLWAASVAEFGMLLRDSEFKGTSSFNDILKMARKAKGNDPHGYRSEFIRIVEAARLIK